jgi:hypothetical protein
MSVSDAVRELYEKFVESELRSDFLYVNSEGMKNRFWRKHAFWKDKTVEEVLKARALFPNETEIPYHNLTVATLTYRDARYDARKRIEAYALRENISRAIDQMRKEGRTDIKLMQ